MSSNSVVMLGATGAVGQQVVKTLINMPLTRLTLLGRRELEGVTGHSVTQHLVDIHNPTSYQDFLIGHKTAICTLGVGQPSKMSKSDFLKIDKDAVLKFATACKQAGIRHFELLSSVGANSSSFSFYLRTKGELEDGLRALNFELLSLFHPSMILTPTNRYGLSQQITLITWPLLSPMFIGALSKFRGINVDELGAAIAKNIITNKQGEEILEWEQFTVQ
ncbi:MAG: NAD(P)H-binding protein [Leptospiraceae bacterium]|nr:NAD(P)H-binding protein [Leptospiraceae bacterium]MCP5495477.1 NAD(P)H-binding protein [Leptospiraceae bacterium]